jgi:hypothetical protein
VIHHSVMKRVAVAAVVVVVEAVVGVDVVAMVSEP